jgi:hypothetical protein
MPVFLFGQLMFATLVMIMLSVLIIAVCVPLATQVMVSTVQVRMDVDRLNSFSIPILIDLKSVLLAS